MQLPPVAIHAAVYFFIIGVLVTFLLVGAFLVVNLGMMSKRPDDRTGERAPSDVAILRNSVWPEEFEEYQLPAESDEEQRRAALQVPAPEPEKKRGTVLSPDEIPSEFAEADDVPRKTRERRKAG